MADCLVYQAEVANGIEGLVCVKLRNKVTTTSTSCFFEKKEAPQTISRVLVYLEQTRFATTQETTIQATTG
jgi:hypothetical protein